MSDKPWLLVDIDGVLNCVGSSTVKFEHEFRKQYRGKNLRIQIVKGAGERLHRLADVFDMHWATMWENEANKDLSPLLAFEPWPFIEWDNHQKALLRLGALSHGTSWKLLDITKYVGGDQPFAWIDDDINDDAYSWAASRSGESLLIKTDFDEGLTEAHVGMLLEFADSLKTEEEPDGNDNDPALD